MFAAYLADSQRKHRRDCTARIDFPHFGCQGAVDRRFRVGDRRIATRNRAECSQPITRVPVGDAPWPLKKPILNAAFSRTNASCNSPALRARITESAIGMKKQSDLPDPVPVVTTKLLP